MNTTPLSRLACALLLLLTAALPGRAARDASLQADFRVVLPTSERALPEPLAPGEKPGFAVRGIKGWAWSPEQYLAEIPVLEAYRMNFLMICYTSMFDNIEAGLGRSVNRWWQPMPEAKRAGYERVIQSCREHGIEFCFGLNPNLYSPRPLDYNSRQDFEDLWRHYEWAQRQGVHWFYVCLDDISQGIDAAGQAKLMNELYRRLRQRDRHAKLITGLPYYWGMGEKPEERAFLEATAKAMHPNIYVFWTGREVWSRTITRADAERYRELVKHRLFVWDNYPVNDAQPTMSLGPLVGRDPQLPAAADGYLSNSMCQQNQANRLPLLTVADYTYNPKAYDPARSIGQAIMHLADTDARRRALADLVELYPGWVILETRSYVNPVRERFAAIIAQPHNRYLAEMYLRGVDDVRARLEREFPDRFQDAAHTLARDREKLQAAYDQHYGK